MPNQGDIPADIIIEPTGRHIGLLSLTLGTAEGTQFGVFRPFSGLLQPDRHRQREWHGPALEYLTLQSLVVEHVRERTVRNTTTETVERSETTVQTADIDDDTDSSPAKSMTVREYIRRQQGEEASDSSSPERSSDLSPEGSREQADIDDTVVQRREETDENEASDLRRHQMPTPPPDPGRDDRPQSSESPSNPSPDRSEPPSWTTLDTTPPEGGRNEGGDMGSIGPTRQTDTPSMTPQQRGPFGGQHWSQSAGPDLVVADSPLPGGSPDAGEASTDKSSTPLSGQSTSPPPGSEQPRRGERSASRDVSDRGTSPMSESPSEPSSSSTSAQSPANQSVPLSLDQVEQPTLDRFVEQLSEKLARHERVERERRGL